MGRTIVRRAVGLDSTVLLFVLGRQAIVYFRTKKLDSYSYQQATELRNQLLEKIFRVGTTNRSATRYRKHYNDGIGRH